MRGFGNVLKDAWRLTAPYFRSEEKWSAWGLLAVVIGLNLSLNGLNLILNFWNGAFFDAIQTKNISAFFQLLLTWHGRMPGFVMIVTVYIAIAVASRYLLQWLQIRWRRWLTARLVNEWLADQAYYRISLTTSAHDAGTDNPDQRISDDLSSFTTDTLSLGLDLLSNIVTLFSFLGILWSLSGSVKLFGFTIPGYMLWVALVYSLLGTGLTHLVGRPLILLRFMQQRFEANFRFALVRLRENVEGVALYSGENEERKGMLVRFADIVRNWHGLMRRNAALNTLISGYAQLATIFPYVVAAPRYFAGEMQLGGLTRTADAFGQVQGAMSWFVNSYSSLASWSATVERLATFERAVADARAAAGTGVQTSPGQDSLTLHDVTLGLPDGRALLNEKALSIAPGESTVLTGRSGSGKSTLIRAIAGIWPFGAGRIERPAGSTLFLPQRPYLPLGTLRHAISYPLRTEAISEDAIVSALDAVGLPHLVARLGEEENWSQLLSGGEQQRLALARALVVKPDWLFLDEATANLDPEAEAEMYTLLKRRLPGTTIVSVAHSPNVARFHERGLVLRHEAGQPGRLAAAQPVA